MVVVARFLPMAHFLLKAVSVANSSAATTRLLLICFGVHISFKSLSNRSAKVEDQPSSSSSIKGKAPV
ncbi:hypothetical protein L1987_34879 [Smallanthus sonchifolius]|uniref:Uncharacterized protein n=1 Tax=Smallanthus sonchifolius TaxID=185202 RepID=A0ACB9HWS1_9ASTR|nr:hypothetical protein L1987_34879 [Smallanthus sonchifolius]